MTIELKGLETIENIMGSALAGPDFSFLNDRNPNIENTFFPRLNNAHHERITGEDRKKLRVVIDTLENFRKLLSDTDEELSESRGTFSNSILTFYRDGELSVVAVPVNSTNKTALGGYLFAREITNLPGGSVFVSELESLLACIPPSESYLRWRWWPIARKLRENNERNAQQLLLTVRTPEETNLLLLAERLQDRVSVSNGQIAPSPDDWNQAISYLESLKELPKTAIVATIDFEQIAILRKNVLEIAKAFDRRDALMESAKSSLKKLQAKRLENHMNTMTLQEFADKVRGSRFPRKLIERIFEDNRNVYGHQDAKCTVGAVLALNKTAPDLFTSSSVKSAIRMMEAYRKDQDLTLGTPSIHEDDDLTNEFLRRIYMIHLDNARAAYPPRSMFTTWEKIFKSDPEEVRFVARNRKHLDQLLNAVEIYKDPDVLKKLSEVIPSVAADEARAFFKKDPAIFQTILSNMGLNELSLEQIAGFLAPELTKAIREIEVDSTHMKSQLRSYQHFGVQYSIHQKRIILGDEMGLGKTVTGLGLISHLKQNGAERFLIVTPLGVMENWRREILKHTDFDSYVLYGENLKTNTAKWDRNGGIALATFESLTKVNSVLSRNTKPADLLIVDEAHFIKNSDTKRTRAAMPWILSSEHLLLMTGTPLENSVDEFIQLIRYAQPNLSIPENKAAYVALRRAIAPAYLRRNQIDVLKELPPKTEIEEYIELSLADVENYKRALKNHDWQRARRAKILAGVNSSTVQRIQDIVKEAMDNNNKVVVFSFYLDVIETLQRILDEDDDYTPLTGALNSVKRQEVIDKFTASEKPGVLLAQIKSGGQGFNIQAANVVVIVEPQVKPSLEEQALRRSYRMGQTKPVTIIKLRGKDTIDERWVEMLNEKKAIFDNTAGVSDAAMLDKMVAGKEHDLFAEELRKWEVE